jgi:uncharacterized protein with PQ loop repeat
LSFLPVPNILLIPNLSPIYNALTANLDPPPHRSISIACWLIVFTPQILQNFRRRSADGLSLTFLYAWLLGDLFNILGAVIQGVLPTMIILAAYYTIADMILLGQCLYYRKYGEHDDEKDSDMEYEYEVDEECEEEDDHGHGYHFSGSGSHAHGSHGGHHGHHDHPVSASHLLDLKTSSTTIPPVAVWSLWKSILFNTFCIISVMLAGIIGFLLSPHNFHQPSDGPDKIVFSPLGQTFGYLCAFLYLASRVPQILLNYRRQSCEGVSILFFLFAGLGNATYVMSILADTWEGDENYGRYVAVNASWLLGSLGTLVLDTGIFAQFWWYRENDEEGKGEGEGERDGENRRLLAENAERRRNYV